MPSLGELACPLSSRTLAEHRTGMACVVVYSAAQKPLACLIAVMPGQAWPSFTPSQKVVASAGSSHGRASLQREGDKAQSLLPSRAAVRSPAYREDGTRQTSRKAVCQCPW